MKQQTRTERVQARTTPDTMAVLKRAAAIQGRSVSDFVIATATEEAQRTIEAAQFVSLSADDQERFAQALIDPPAPAPALVRAARRHDQFVNER